MFYREKDGVIIDFANWKYSNDCLETEKVFESINGKPYIVGSNEHKKALERHNLVIQNNKAIRELKDELAKAKEDVEQVELFGMKRADYETKKARCVEIIQQLRILEKEV